MYICHGEVQGCHKKLFIKMIGWTENDGEGEQIMMMSAKWAKLYNQPLERGTKKVDGSSSLYSLQYEWLWRRRRGGSITKEE